MILTREEREKQIVELYEQGHTYKQIAGLARVSVRDIKPILEMAEKEKERRIRQNHTSGKRKRWQ